MEELFIRYGLYLWLVSLLLVVGLGIWLCLLQRRLTATLAHYHRLTAGTNEATLPQVLEYHLERVQRAAGRVDDLDEKYLQMEKVLRGAVQHVGLVRYNPFGDTGGDQSFSLALLNAAGDGVVISSLYARDRTRVYAKPVTNRRSTYHLSDEEEQAISLAGAPGGEPVERVPTPREVTPT